MNFFILTIITLSVLNNTYSWNVSETSATCDVPFVGPWSMLLEEWATSADLESSGRQGRIMALPPSSGYVITERMDSSLIPLPPAAHPQPYEEWFAATAPPLGPGKIVNRPSNHYMDKFKPSYPPPQHNKPLSSYSQKPQRPTPVDRVDEPPRKQVTETDLYLLSAIEKLVYRADLMEKRLRKLEESMHLLVAGNAYQAEESCVENFTRVGETCYHFSSEAANWKTAILACRRLHSNLLELNTDSERRKVLAYLLTDKKHKTLDWWTGGLNPGLLWIWSNSARPVASNSSAVTGAPALIGDSAAVTIVGEGRCLALIYDAVLRALVYRGQDCGLNYRYVCEKVEEKTKLSNEIERVSRTLTSKNKGI